MLEDFQYHVVWPTANKEAGMRTVGKSFCIPAIAPTKSTLMFPVFARLYNMASKAAIVKIFQDLLHQNSSHPSFLSACCSLAPGAD